ncbi:Sodium/hydrogen exchanger 9 [Hypsibius exemplaris]|uniref:Sodium/hydrogen exchanger n=1 Tax=Hypsibius exemplaris TaxID=2072580 RepID=A0A1W0X260_HYPEX|nr:Sodium/hydrogen exchanger 9 [Hypsibius exemplaris]
MDNSLPIEIRADEHLMEGHRMDSLNILIYLMLLSLTVVTVWIFKHRRFQYIHETGLAIFYGLIVGAIIRYASPAGEVSHLRVVPEFIPPSTDTTPLGAINLSSMTDATGKSSPGAVEESNPGPPDTVWLLSEVKKSGGVRENKTFAYALRGEVLNAGENKETGKLLQQKATFDPEVFFNIILPPIIFSAGYSMKRRHFFKNFGAIFTFAILGSTISVLVVAAICFAFTRLMPALAFTFNDCLFFGAIISSTDPVTILAVFHDIRVDVTLHALVFGESALNDAVAIVFANSVQSYAYYRKGEAFDTTAFFKAFGNFFSVFLGSASIGAALGSATALLTKFTRLADFPLLETALFVLMSYSTFLIAEAAELTGIVAVLFCGIFQAHYTYNNLSRESQDHSKFSFELLSFLAENFIFCYIGVSMFTFPYHYWSIPFIMVAFLAVILGRICNIYPLSALLNLGRKRKIPLNFQHMIFFSGLKGAISFALAIRNTVTPARQAMLTATSVIVIISVTVAGGAAGPLLNFLRIPTGVTEDAEKRLSRSVSSSSVSNRAGQEYGSASHPSATTDRTWAAKLWRSFDVSYMKPLLTHSRPTLMDTLPDCCSPVARFLTSSRQFGQDRWKDLENDRRGIVEDEDEMDEMPRMESVGPSVSRETVTAQPKGSVSPRDPGSPRGHGSASFIDVTTAFDARDLPV